MPAPVVKPTGGSEPLTHRVKLVNGASYTVLRPEKPGSPYRFLNNVPQNVPASVAKYLKEKAVDNVTVSAGKNVSQQTMQKFDIKKLDASGAAPEDAAE